MHNCHLSPVLQLMEFLRSKHPTMAQVLELVLGDIGSRFVPKPEERLLAVVHALLLRCYKLPFSNAAGQPCNVCWPTSSILWPLDSCRVCHMPYAQLRLTDMSQTNMECYLSSLSQTVNWKPKP